MVTRALAAEIRHASATLVTFLEERAELDGLGELHRVRCEADERLDLILDLVNDRGDLARVGIEAKFDHSISRDQIERESKVVDHLFVLVAHRDDVPAWLREEYPDVHVIEWAETLRCFHEPRISEEDLASIRLMKTTVQRYLQALDLGARLPGWKVEVVRGGSGMPGVVIESPPLADHSRLCGGIEVAGRGMPADLADVLMVSHIGVSVAEIPENYFDPEVSDVVPTWIERLRTLDREVLEPRAGEFPINTRKPGTSTRPLGRYKTPLALKHLGAKKAYLAKGYTDGWAIGPKMIGRPLDELEDVANVTVEIFRRWWEAEAVRG